MDLPRILVIDDVYGRPGRAGRNTDRYDFCYRLKLVDVTGDENGSGEGQKIDKTVAEAAFCRGQVESDGTVRNDENLVLRVVRQGWDRIPVWALVLLDLHFKTGRVGPGKEPEGNLEDRDPRGYFGLELLERIKSEHSDLPVVVLSSMERIPIEAELGRRLADHFVEKDALTHQGLADLLWHFGLIEDHREIIKGRSRAMLKCLRDARKAAASGRENVLLLGETGTGKELFARYIHDLSPKAQGPFVSIDLHRIPPTLIENELFGSEPGAFTDAKQTKVGAAEEADQGTLFIDEFHGIPESVQAKLLRLLDPDVREVKRSGPKAQPRRLDLQVVIATNDLDIRVSGEYRGDLLRRLPALTEVRLPPLRERKDEMPELAAHLTRKAEAKLAESRVSVWQNRVIEPDALLVLAEYSWPENVGELDSVMTWVVREYPGLGVVSANHIRRALATVRMGREAASEVGKDQTPPIGRGGTGVDGQSLEQLLALLDEYEFKPEFESVAGKLPAIHGAFGRFLVRYLKAALLFKREPLPGVPEGRINMTGAVKCMTGRDLKTAQAADVVRKLLTTFPEAQDEVEQDQILREILSYAVRLRQGRGREGRGSVRGPDA